MPLKPIVVDEPFVQWGLYLIGMINPMSSTSHKWVLTATDYFTCWTEEVPLKNATRIEILIFLKELISRFGPPKTIMLDNAWAFIGSRVTQISLCHGIYLKNSSNDYPQGNGLAKLTNKNLIRLIKRMGAEHKREWNHDLRTTLWVDRVTPKRY